MMKMRWGPVILIVGSAACAPAARMEQPTSPAAAVAPAPDAAEVSDALHWVRSAVEHRALFLQTYRAAADALRESAAGREPGTWAVIVDADETVLDNSAFELRLARTGQTYNEEIWNAWVREEAAPALPGAVEFISLVKGLGGRVAIVTNRELAVCEETRRNLEAVGARPDAVLCKGDTSDKDPRFEAVRTGRGTGMPAVDVLIWVGDNIGDFPDGSQDLGDAALREVGRSWFVLPNPMYGSWESVPIGEEGEPGVDG